MAGKTGKPAAEVEAANEIYKIARQEADLEIAKMREREQLVAECHEIIGRIQGVQMLVKFGDVTNLVWLKEVKETKVYKDLPNIGTWEKFCNYMGLDRHTVDQKLLNLAAFGEDFLETVTKMKVGYRDLRKLRQLTHDGCVQIEGNLVVIGDESIPLDPDHREDLQSALERIIDAKDALLAEKDANLKTKDRLIQDKQKLIEQQARELTRYEGEAESKGLRADEDAFIKKCGAARVTIDGFLSKFDPELNPLPEDATPRMKAALMETLGYFRRTIAASYDTAGDLYGDPELDDDWVPPHLRTEEETPEG